MILSTKSRTRSTQSAAEPTIFVSSRLQLYFVFSSITTLLLFSLLTICLCNINSALSRTSQITVLLSTLVFSITSLSALIISVKQSLQISSLSAKRYFQYQSIIQYAQSFPLAYLSFHFFTRVHYLRSTGLLDYSILAVCTVYFSLTAIFNQIITEIKLTKGFTKLTAPKLLFSFLFRYFFFAAKLINAVLFLSTVDDYILFSIDTDDSSDKTSDPTRSNSTQIVLVFSIYLVAAYTVYFLWYLNANTRKRSTVFSLFYEPFKMLVDHNDRYFNRRLQYAEPPSVRANSFQALTRKLFNFNSAKLIFYLFINFTCHLVLAYYWYFCSMMALSKMIQAKINVFSLLNSKRLLVNLWELEEVLKFRQFMLISVLGSVIISALSYHIFYQYYFNYDASWYHSARKQNPCLSEFVDDGSSEFCVRKESLLEKARHSSLRNDNLTTDDGSDSFSIDSFQHSSSISSISLQIYKLDKRDPVLFGHQTAATIFSMPELTQSSGHMRSVEVDSLSLNNSSSQSRFSSSSSFFYSSIDLRSDFRRTMTTLNFPQESSSGVNSSATSSLSSIYQQFQRTCEPYSFWTVNMNTRGGDSRFSVDNLALPELSAYENGVKQTCTGTNAGNLNRKVADWFSKASVLQHLDMDVDSLTGLDMPLSFSASSDALPSKLENKCSSPVHANLVVNDSTFKTDFNSQFACLI